MPDDDQMPENPAPDRKRKVDMGQGSMEQSKQAEEAHPNVKGPHKVRVKRQPDHKK